MSNFSSALSPVANIALVALITSSLPSFAQGIEARAAPNAGEHSKLPLSLEQLLQFTQDQGQRHEGRPAGVPASYDWFSMPKRDRWNAPPAGFTAITGWGQAFWSEGSGLSTARLALRQHQTLICHGTERIWSLVQKAPVEGAEFRPDFKDNVAVKTPHFETTREENVVGWSANGAFHFWPAGGRAALPAGSLCGVLILVQARKLNANSAEAPPMQILIGLGADYWLDKAAPWRNYTTNSGVGMGRLKHVPADWTWFGFSSATEEDLRRLHESGYRDDRH